MSWHAERRLSTSSRRTSSSAALPGSPSPSSRLNLASPSDNGYITVSNPAVLERLGGADPDELQIWPTFLDEKEQRVLLGAALKKLDATVGGREERKRRREWLKREKLQGELVGALLDASKSPSNLSSRSELIQSSALAGFAPDEVYDWQDRHFDGG